MMDYLWLIIFACTHAMAYILGKREGLENTLEDDWREIKMYEVDKRFEHMRWLEERKNHHDAG